MPRVTLPVSGLARCPWCTRDKAKLVASRIQGKLSYFVECGFCQARGQVITYEGDEIEWALANEKLAVKEVTDVWDQVSNALLEQFPFSESEAEAFERRIIHIRHPENDTRYGVITNPPIIKRRYRHARYRANELRWWQNDLEYN